MKELSNYIIEKYRINKNTYRYYVKGKFYINPNEEYYTISFMSLKSNFSKDHLIYYDKNRKCVYLYSKDDLIKKYKNLKCGNLCIKKFEDKFKEKIKDILDNKIPVTEYVKGDYCNISDLDKYEKTN